LNFIGRILLIRQIPANKEISMRDRIGDSNNLSTADSHSLGVLAHEIKSPISSVIQLLYSVELLLSSPGTEEARKLVGRAIKRAESALALARSMLDYTRIDHTRDTSRSDTVIPADDLESLLETHRQNAAGKGITLICDLRDTECNLQIQQFSWHIIVNNLVSNAIRYSKRNQGPQRIWISSFLDGNQFILEVRDEGIGMTRQDHENLFRQFFRGSEALEQTTSGSGFGLSMVKMILDEIGGDIQCLSEKDAGTTFRVNIPIIGSEKKE
jgi:signal transduction histidine kinase